MNDRFEDRFERVFVEPVFKMGHVGTLFYNSHGWTDGIHFPGTVLSSEALMNCCPNDKVPAILASACSNALESYNRGSDTLGQLYTDAVYSIVAHNRMTGHRMNTAQMFPFVLLGDPALRIPRRP